MSNPLNPPATQAEIKEYVGLLEQKYRDLIKRCKVISQWDGRIRVGPPLKEAEINEARVCFGDPNTPVDVLEQLALQLRKLRESPNGWDRKIRLGEVERADIKNLLTARSWLKELKLSPFILRQLVLQEKEVGYILINLLVESKSP